MFLSEQLMNNKLCRYVQGSYFREYVKHQEILLIVWLQLIAKMWQNIGVDRNSHDIEKEIANPHF